MRTAGSAAAAAAVLFLLPVILLAFQNGPVPGVTGGFNEPTCGQCHQGKPPGDRALTVTAPKTYRPGQTYQLRVTLSRKGLEVGGFEVAARYRSGPQLGKQAGDLRAADARTQVVTGNVVQYAQHTDAGSRAAAPGKLTWVVQWRAPAQSAGEVIFHVAANASNADSSPLGDAIYTAEAVARPAPAGGRRVLAQDLERDERRRDRGQRRRRDGRPPKGKSDGPDLFQQDVSRTRRRMKI